MRRRTLLALALLLATATPALAQQSSAILENAPVEIQEAFAHADRGRQARWALDKVLQSGKVNRDILTAAVHNPHFARYVVDTMIDLEKVHDVPGVERVLERIGQANDVSGPRGASFEISVGARLRPQLAELSANVEGYEVDARLTDGTIVEVKYIESRHSGHLIHKAIDQLKLRGAAARNQKVMLVVNRALKPEQLGNIHHALDGTGGGDVRIFEASRSGYFHQQTATPKMPPAVRPTIYRSVPRSVAR